MAGSGMDVDPPSSTTMTPTTVGGLKRSNSAPMINILGLPPTSTSGAAVTMVTCAVTTVTSASIQPECSHWGLRPTESLIRTRRYSTSSTGLHSPNAAMRIPSRLEQLKQEATGMALVNREVAHEKEIQSSLQMSQSCEELRLDDHMMMETSRRPKSFNEQLHIFTPPYSFAGSPSPTRVGKQCFSPSLGQPVKGDMLTPSPSPSPTRKVFRTSLSPIAFRPSPLGPLKRKIELDNTERDCSPAKRVSRCSTPERDRLLTNHPLIHRCHSAFADQNVDLDHCSSYFEIFNVFQGKGSIVSISSSSMEESSSSGSPDQLPPATSSHDFTFRPVRTLSPNMVTSTTPPQSMAINTASSTTHRMVVTPAAPHCIAIGAPHQMGSAVRRMSTSPGLRHNMGNSSLTGHGITAGSVPQVGHGVPVSPPSLVGMAMSSIAQTGHGLSSPVLPHTANSMMPGGSADISHCVTANTQGRQQSMSTDCRAGSTPLQVGLSNTVGTTCTVLPGAHRALPQRQNSVVMEEESPSRDGDGGPTPMSVESSEPAAKQLHKAPFL